MYSLKPKAIILDMDGTLCDVTSVRHYVTGEHRDFDSFHRSSLFCPPNAWVADLTRNLRGAEHVIVTGRSARYQSTTRNWLAKWDIPYNRLIMRRDHDQRPDYVVKEEILIQKILPYYDVVLAVDDNPSVIKVWESHGIPVIVVPGWEE